MKFTTAFTVAIFTLLAHPGESTPEDVKDQLLREVANLLTGFQSGSHYTHNKNTICQLNFTFTSTSNPEDNEEEVISKPVGRVIQVSFNLTIPDLALNGNFSYLSSSYPYRKYTANFTISYLPWIV